MAKKVIAQRVYFRLPDGGQRSRVFMETREFSPWEWRASLAVLELGDLGGWFRVEFIGVRPIMSEN